MTDSFDDSGTDMSGAARGGLVATLLASVFALAIGLAVGFITTFTHGQILGFWGIVIGLAIVAALVVGFRLVFPGRAIAAAAGVGVLAAAAVLALPADAGTVLAFEGPAATSSWIWAIGCIVLAVTAVAWPMRARETE